MSGSLRFGELEQGESFPLALEVEVQIEDVDRFVSDPDHEAEIGGRICCPALGGALPVDDGVLNLFVESGVPGRRLMRYRIRFRDAVGHPLTLVGVKTVEDDRGFDAWKDTTTLETAIYAGHLDAADEGAREHELLATGTLRLSLLAFLQQLTTFRPVLARPTLRVGRFFFGSLWDAYARRKPART
jgi:hypothetical protein